MLDIFRMPTDIYKLYDKTPIKDNFVFCLDSALEILGYTTVASFRAKILMDFDSGDYQLGINFVDKNRFPEYTEDDIIEHNDFKVTSKLRTLLDLFIEEFDDLALEYIDELREEYSAEEVIGYFEEKGYSKLLKDKLDFIGYNIYTMEGSYYDHV